MQFLNLEWFLFKKQIIKDIWGKMEEFEYGLHIRYRYSNGIIFSIFRCHNVIVIMLCLYS